MPAGFRKSFMLTRSSTELVRQQNKGLVLVALRRKGPLAHTEIAHETGLSSATISAITAELEHERIIERAELQSSGGRGRPRLLFRQRRDAGYVIIVRISSDVIQLSLVDYSGVLIDRFDEPRPAPLADTRVFLAALRAGLERIIARSRLAKADIMAIAISSKGLVAADRPVLVWSPIFGREQIDFSEALAPDWRAEVTLDNESLLVATAVRREREVATLATLSLGHSIGLGVVQGRSAPDAHASAPNFGHMLHQPDGALCRCGSRGCIEAYAGFYAILRTAFEVPEDTIPANFVPIAEVDKIAARARQGDRMAGFAFRQAGSALGIGLARVLSLYETMPIVVGGPGVRFYELMRAGLEDGLRQSLNVRLEGMPEISVVFNEETLVFDGTLQKTLARIDRTVFAGRTNNGGDR